MDTLRFLGIGSAFNPVLKNNNGWFVCENQLYIIDCGETAFEPLAAMREVREYADIFVVITHLHGDHAGSLAAFVTYCVYELDKKVHVIHPEATVCDLLRLMGVHDDDYVYHKAMPENASARFTAIPVEHTKDMRCYGYVITTKNWCIYFSGDALGIPKSVSASFFAGEIDTIYQDTSLISGGHHCYLGDLETLFPPEFRSRVYCMHLEADAEVSVRKAGFQIPAKYCISPNQI